MVIWQPVRSVIKKTAPMPRRRGAGEIVYILIRYCNVLGWQLNCHPNIVIYLVSYRLRRQYIPNPMAASMCIAHVDGSANA